jgi:hypothetical protein
MTTRNSWQLEDRISDVFVVWSWRVDSSIMVSVRFDHDVFGVWSWCLCSLIMTSERFDQNPTSSQLNANQHHVNDKWSTVEDQSPPCHCTSLPIASQNTHFWQCSSGCRLAYAMASVKMSPFQWGWLIWQHLLRSHLAALTSDLDCLLCSQKARHI